MNTFWDYLVRNFLSPIRFWNDAADLNDPGQYGLAIVAALFMWVIPVVIIWVIAYFITKGVRWIIRREHCQHCQAWTIGPAGEEFAGCNSSEPCCVDCCMEHIADAEPRYKCPVDGSEMTKVINHLNLIIDKCPSCEGVWLGGSELQRLLDDAEEDGEATGMVTGVAVGLAVN